METISEKANNAAKAASEDFAYVEAMNNDGTPVKISKEVLRRLISESINQDAMQDGVFVLYKDNSEKLHVVSPSRWEGMDSSGKGNVALGVCLHDGMNTYVIALTGCQEMITWSQEAVAGGGAIALDRSSALADYKGKESTAIQVKQTACSGANVAVGFADKYNNGSGLKWWLPSLGELMDIYANKTKINYALSKIAGAKPLENNAHWSSTELNNWQAWVIYFSTGEISEMSKTYKMYVRPITKL